VAILTISASTGYAIGECMGRGSSFNRTFREAAPFYSVNVIVAVIAAAVILIPGVPLLSIALNANVLATVLLPFTLVFVLMLANDRQLMGRWVNGVRSNVLALAIVALVSVCGAAYGIDSFLLQIHVLS
jgi:Mn2+/Fe2+ NRAMP family transporter